MTLDQIIERAKGYRVGDMSGEHNFGEIMADMQSLLILSADTLRKIDTDPDSHQHRTDCINAIEALLNADPVTK